MGGGPLNFRFMALIAIETDGGQSLLRNLPSITLKPKKFRVCLRSPRASSMTLGTQELQLPHRQKAEVVRTGHN